MKTRIVPRRKPAEPKTIHVNRIVLTIEFADPREVSPGQIAGIMQAMQAVGARVDIDGPGRPIPPAA
jgi:hypothetical protein